MAKDLPYFKFFCSEWNDGDISLEDMKTQGVFVNICSYYWSNECNISEKKLNKKFSSHTKQIENLIESDIVKVIDGVVEINFLNEQLQERGKLSSQNSINAKKRWEKMRTQCEKDANALKSQSDNDAIKKREEKKREDKKERFVFRKELLNYGFNSELVDDWLKVRKTKKATNTETAFKKFISEVEKSTEEKNVILKKCVENSWKGFESSWLKNIQQKNNFQNNQSPYPYKRILKKFN